MEQEPIPFPVRINRYLALRGYATRRGAEDLILRGAVTINGRKAALSDRVGAEDEVEITGFARPSSDDFFYFVYYKPRGIITHSPQAREKSIGDVASVPEGVFPVGRLDKESEGLIILTDDGRVTDRLLNPRLGHEKEYEVAIQERIVPGVAARMREGITDRGELLRAKDVKVNGPHSMNIILTEGKKHQIRRMLGGARLTVQALKRVRIMDVHLGNLKPGQARALRGTAREGFLRSIGL